ncbi:MAG: hypothetical protein ACMG50_06335 [Thermomonas sp.]
MTRLLAIPTVFLATLVLAACAKPNNVLSAVSDNAVVELKPRQTIILANKSLLRYVSLVSDSRCAPDVQCVWAGDAVVALNWTSANGTSRDLELHSNRAQGADTADMDGKRITFTHLSPKGTEASFEVTTLP